MKRALILFVLFTSVRADPWCDSQLQLCCNGFYRNNAQFANERCLKCQAGFFCVNNIAYNCGSEQFSTTGSTACSTWSPTCPIGYYEFVAPTVYNDRVCAKCLTRCLTGQFINGQLCTTPDRKTAGPICTDCLTTCSTGSYLSNSCTGEGSSSSQCIPCTTGGCTSGYYRGQCGTTSDGTCTQCKTCPTGQYNYGCAGNTDGVCKPCTLCGQGYTAVSACSALADAVCGNGPCSPGTDCGSLFCDYGIDTTDLCKLQWATTNYPATNADWICLHSATSGTCQPCPTGWTAVNGGGECVQCSTGLSCDTMGNEIVDSVECPPNSYPAYDPISVEIQCFACNINTTALRLLSNAVLSRGGVYINNPPNITKSLSVCSAYTTCTVGYVFQGRTMKCIQCVTPGTGWGFTTHGLTTDDIYSCLSAIKTPAIAPNAAGFYGDLGTKCRQGYTSTAGEAGQASDCFPCPLLTYQGEVVRTSPTCDFYCTDPYVSTGMACVSHVMYTSCGTNPGYINTYTSNGQVCDVMPMPWNSPGFTKDSIDIVSTLSLWRQPEDGPVVDIDDNLTTMATMKNLYLNTEKICNYQDTVLTEQDMPLIASLCSSSSTQYHHFYMVRNMGGYIWVQLKRSFGNNNKYIMWKIKPTNQNIINRWRLPGRVTSMANSTINGVAYVYLVFKDLPVIAYTMDDPTKESAIVVPNIGLPQAKIISNDVRILIGTDETGQMDGLRDTARFESELSIATGSDPTRLFVLDTINCRLAEVRIDSPGSWWTAVKTIEANCFNTAAIPNPTMLTSVLHGAMLLFMTDTGIWQMDGVFRDLTLVVPQSEIMVSNVMAIGANTTTIRVWNGTHLQEILPLQTPCPSGQVSTPGATCTPCAVSQYADTDRCLPCTDITCGPGLQVVPCSSNANTQCAPCPSNLIPSPPYRIVSGCHYQQIGPCPLGKYAANAGDDCILCPGGMWGTTLAIGATSVQDCLCSMHGTWMQSPPLTCLIQSPYTTGTNPDSLTTPPDWLHPHGCTEPDLVGDTKCEFTCDGLDLLDCKKCGATGWFLQQVNPRICQQCPLGTQGNGLYCETCKGLRDSTELRDSCICRPPAIWEAPSSCACPAGFILGANGQSCVSCPKSSIRNQILVLTDTLDQPSDSTQCEECSTGFTSDSTSTYCTMCPVGQYRESGQVGCQECTDSGINYASDSSAGSSCAPCQSSCNPGFRAVPCPINPSLLQCNPCPALVPPQTWVLGATNTNCYWTCPPQFYIGADGCMPCSTQDCPSGYTLSTCSTYADATCDVPCSNTTMPRQNAHFLPGCAWACDEGYSQVDTPYTGWVDYNCL